VDPQLVRKDRLATAGKGSESGVRGDPARATAEIGRKGAQLMVDASTEAIRRATGRP
jgi:creatinine amidohydrolase